MRCFKAPYKCETLINIGPFPSGKRLGKNYNHQETIHEPHWSCNMEKVLSLLSKWSFKGRSLLCIPAAGKVMIALLQLWLPFYKHMLLFNGHLNIVTIQFAFLFPKPNALLPICQVFTLLVFVTKKSNNNNKNYYE